MLVHPDIPFTNALSTHRRLIATNASAARHNGEQEPSSRVEPRNRLSKSFRVAHS